MGNNENEKLVKTRTEFAASNDESKASEALPVDIELKNRVNVASKLIATMDESSVAGLLKQSADSGELVYAGLLLKSLDERKGGKVLAALKDPILVDQLLRAAGLSE